MEICKRCIRGKYALYYPVMKQICEAYWLGTVDYEKAWRLQDDWAAEIARGERPPTLLLLEHPHTYTFGRRGHAENLLWSEQELLKRGVSVHWVDRGGDVTYHGPGQLVGYPLLPLAPDGLSSREFETTGRLPRADFIGYLRKLEEVLIQALAAVGVSAQRLEGLTGVWVRPSPVRPLAKIAAIGIKVDARGISRHGFALNINPDMSYWNGIIGCGLKESSVTSLAELIDPVPSVEQFCDLVLHAFQDVFGYTVRFPK